MSKNIIECGKGWAKIYNPIIKKILDFDSTKKSESEKIGILKVYELYGALEFKFYHERNVPKDILNDISRASIKSLNVCSLCGEDTNDLGATINEPYITCCKRCWEEEILPKNKNSIWKSFKTNKFYKNSGEYE